MNLCEENPKINVQQLSTAVGWEFMRTTALSLQDGGMELANQQKGFQMVQPSEQWFPGKYLNILNKINQLEVAIAPFYLYLMYK